MTTHKIAHVRAFTVGAGGGANGRMKVPETPGFGVELNPEVELVRPVTH